MTLTVFERQVRYRPQKTTPFLTDVPTPLSASERLSRVYSRDSRLRTSICTGRHQNKLGDLPFQQPPVPLEVARNHPQEDCSCDRLSVGQQINSALFFGAPPKFSSVAIQELLCVLCAWLVLPVFIDRPFPWPWRLCWKRRETASEAEWELCVKDRVAWTMTALSSEWNGPAVSRNTCSATQNGMRVSKRFPDSAGCLTDPGVGPRRPDLEHLCTISLEDSVAESGFLFGGLSDTLL